MTNQNDGVWIIDADARTLYANTAMADILATNSEAMVGAPSFHYLFAEDLEAAQRLFDGKQKGNASPFHFRLRREDRSAIWVDVQGTPMHTASGDFIGIVGTFSVSPNQF